MFITTRPQESTIVSHTMDALVDRVIATAKEADMFPTTFENALKVYAEAYYQSVIVPDLKAQEIRKQRIIESWSEVSNEKQEDDEEDTGFKWR